MTFSKSSLLTATFAVTASAYSSTARTFAVNHFYGDGPLLSARMDPIISPGGVSSHLHTIQGGSAFAETMSDTTALSSNCTSSLIKNDLSDYWTPSMFFENDNGTFTAVPMFYMNVYYFFEATTDKITAFQPGHRMVIGDPTLRTPPASGGASIVDKSQGTPQPVQFTCPRTSTAEPLYPVDSDGLHGAGIQDPQNDGAGVGFPDQNCDGYASPLRADVHFPSCYNPAAGLDNYKENMDWPTNGNCPEGWVHTPHIFYEVYWNTPLFADLWTPGQGKQPFVLAMGDRTGYGLHGDFISGWDEATLQQIIDNCDAGDNGMDKCPGLIGGVNDPSTTCNIDSPINEVISGNLAALPGNNPPTGWGVGTTPDSVVSAVSSVASSISPLATSAVSKASSSVSASTKSASASANSVTTSLATKVSAVVAQTTVSVSATATASSSSSSISGYTYAGCYADQEPTRSLSGKEFANVGAVSDTNCIAYCSTNGFSVAGTEYGGQCFCGSALPSTKLDDSKCDMACEGDATQTCGGSLSLSVWSKGSVSRVKRHLHRHVMGLA